MKNGTPVFHNGVVEAGWTKIGLQFMRWQYMEVNKIESPDDVAMDFLK